MFVKLNLKFVNFLLLVLLFFLVSSFVVLLFKNIQYGILWNDEAETVMYARSIIKHGYPKVHFGKNVLNVAETKDLSVGVKESIDAWIYISSWGGYYLAVPAVFLADKFNDVYFRTLVLRVYFAFFGFLGILIFGYVGSLFFKDLTQKLIFYNLYFVFEILSVTLLLHLRQVRHFSFTIFFLSLFFLILAKRLIEGKINNLAYQFFGFILLMILMNVYLPAFLSCVSLLIFIAIVDFYRFQDIKKILKNNFYLILLFFLFSFYIYFFEFFKVSGAISEEFGYNISRFVFNFKTALVFFLKSEYLFLSVFLLFVLLLFYLKRRTLLFLNKSRLTFIIYLSSFILISLIITSRIPYFFERYFIFLQPILIVLLISLFLSIWEIFCLSNKNNSYKWIFVYFVFLLVFVGLVFKAEAVKGYLYELTHLYRGPMDFFVEYVVVNYPKHEDLVIATNYEEYVLMYYLGSRVIVGYVGNNLDEDLKLTPDIVLIRKNRPNFVRELNYFLEKGNYKEITLNVYDYPVNNIPEMTLPLKHLFSTPKTDKKQEMLGFYVLEK